MKLNFLLFHYFLIFLTFIILKIIFDSRVLNMGVCASKKNKKKKGKKGKKHKGENPWMAKD